MSSLSSLNKILWLRKENSFFNHWEKNLEKDFSLRTFSSHQKKIDWRDMVDESLLAIVFEFDQDTKKIEDIFLIFQQLKIDFPESPLILINRHPLSLEDMVKVNQSGVHFFFNENDDFHDLHKILKKLDEKKFSDRLSQEKLFELKKQNQQIEKEVRGLAQISQHRLEEWKIKRKTIYHQLREMIRLTQFVKNLTGLISIEDLLEVLWDETKSFHQVRSPILGCLLPNQSPLFFYFQNGKAHTKWAEVVWSDETTQRRNEKSDSKYLADCFSRPFGPILTIPLLSSRKNESSSAHERSVHSLLFFEHSLNFQQQEIFLQFIEKRIQPLSVTLDKILFTQELKSTSRLWEESFEDFADPIAIIDGDYHLLRGNKSFSSFKIMKKDQSVETKCYEQFRMQKEVCPACPLARSVSSVDSSSMNSSVSLLKRVQRETNFFEVHSYPIFLNEKKKNSTYINHYVDVTRSRSLQAQVAQAEKVSALGHLAGHIAHELNNPLTGIRATAQILLHDLRPGNNLYNDLLEVEKAASRCQLIIKNLLDFSRREGEVSLTVVSLNAIVEKTLPLLKTAMHPFQKEIELTTESTDVQVEPQLVQQVIFNLIHNACQAMNGSGTIIISTLRFESESRTYVELKVRDTGEGISKEIQDFIFNPFFTTKKMGKGTGLGLSISKGIVERFGGEISFSSPPQQGTEFMVRLPAAVKQR